MKHKENYSVFEYNPQGERLILKTNEKIQYDFDKQKYFIDQNPLGEEKLEEIYDIKVSEDFNSIEFITIYRKKEKPIKLIMNNNIDKLFYKFFHETMNKGIIVKKNELDRIEIIALNNKLDTMYIYKKNAEYELINSLGIVTKDDVLYYEEVEPEYKLYELIETKIENKRIIIVTKEKNVEFTLDIQEDIYNFLEKIIENIK